MLNGDIGMTPAKHWVTVHLNGEGGIGFNTCAMKWQTTRLLGGEVTTYDQIKKVA